MGNTLHEPYGFEQGDPLIICRSDDPDDIRRATKYLEIKGYYCGPGAALCSRRHDKVYIYIHNKDMTMVQFASFWQWIAQNVMTKLPPKGGRGVVFV